MADAGRVSQDGGYALSYRRLARRPCSVARRQCTLSTLTERSCSAPQPSKRVVYFRLAQLLSTQGSQPETRIHARQEQPGRFIHSRSAAPSDEHTASSTVSIAMRSQFSGNHEYGRNIQLDVSDNVPRTAKNIIINNKNNQALKSTQAAAEKFCGNFPASRIQRIHS